MLESSLRLPVPQAVFPYDKPAVIAFQIALLEGALERIDPTSINCETRRMGFICSGIDSAYKDLKLLTRVTGRDDLESALWGLKGAIMTALAPHRSVVTWLIPKVSSVNDLQLRELRVRWVKLMIGQLKTKGGSPWVNLPKVREWVESVKQGDQSV